MRYLDGTYRHASHFTSGVSHSQAKSNNVLVLAVSAARIFATSAAVA
jgi:hypothetical protein